MFDKTKHNIILMTDYSHPLFLQRLLGVTKVADSLRNEGFEVLVINHLHIFSIEEIIQILNSAVSDKTLYIGFNSIFYQGVDNAQIIDNAENHWEKGGIKFSPKESGSFLPHGKKYNTVIKQLIRSISPNCKIVLGGPDAEDIDFNSDYDYVVQGLADISAVNLARHLAFGDALNNSRKSVFKFTVIDDPTAKGYDFVGTQMKYHEHDIVLPNETLPIEIGRGCIFQCKFCSFPLNGKKKMTTSNTQMCCMQN